MLFNSQPLHCIISPGYILLSLLWEPGVSHHLCLISPICLKLLYIQPGLTSHISIWCQTGEDEMLCSTVCLFCFFTASVGGCRHWRGALHRWQSLLCVCTLLSICAGIYLGIAWKTCSLLALCFFSSTLSLYRCDATLNTVSAILTRFDCCQLGVQTAYHCAAWCSGKLKSESCPWPWVI